MEKKEELGRDCPDRKADDGTGFLGEYYYGYPQFGTAAYMSDQILVMNPENVMDQAGIRC